MNMTETHAPDVAIPFSPAEMEHFHSEDRHAAGVLVVLMTVIFSIGLLLYATIAFICS